MNIFRANNPHEGLCIFLPFINLHLWGTSQRDQAVVDQWGQRYTALYIQIGRQLPPLTYTLAIWGLRSAGKTGTITIDSNTVWHLKYQEKL